MSRKFDRYMVAIGASRHVKFRRLTVPERYAFFLGVLSVAAQAPVRGCLLVGSLNAEAADIAAEADISEKVAESALVKLRQIGIIYHDDDLGCERVHDFEEQWNPAPKFDNTGAVRQKRYREKLRAEGRSRSVSGSVKDAVIARDNGVCVVCGSADRIEFHHRKPVAEGGGNEVENLELRCFDCHRGSVSHDVTSRVTHSLARGEVEEKEEEKKPPLTPPLRGGELGQPVDLSEGKPNPRATGTNPRAIGRQHVQAVSANAAAVLDAPSDEERQAWEQLHALLARSVEGGAGAVHVMDAYLAGVDGGVFVIDAPTTAWAWLAARADRALPACCDRLGVRARLASDAEHEGLQRVAA